MSLDPFALRTLAWIGAALAVAAYFAALAMRPSAVRMLNGSGLFFTGLALVAVGGAGGRADAPLRSELTWATAFLIVAALAQAAAALRNRKAWDGAERRAGGRIVEGSRG